MATRFWLYLMGQGEGCDYTIGCNLAVRELRAQTLEEAHVEARSVLGPGWYSDLGPQPFDGGYQIGYAFLLDVRAVEELPLDQWRAEAQRIWDAENARLAEERERAELERLKAKYGE